MAGHSKWSQIKRQKGAADAKRGAAFGKLAAAITVAARQGSDPETNFQLRLTIDKARAANMPKDNIERAIDRISTAAGSELQEIMFEAYGPGGTAFLIETATDNRNRTIGEIRAALNKHEGKLAEAGSVGYLFKKLGLITIPAADKAEEIELAAIEAGASDVDTDDEQVFITTQPAELAAVREKLIAQRITPAEVSFEWEPTATIAISDPDTGQKVQKLSEVLEDIDDVTKVSSNFEL